MRNLRSLYDNAKNALRVLLDHKKGVRNNIPLEEAYASAEHAIAYDFERDHQTFEVCAKCWGVAKNDRGGEVWRWLTTNPMCPSDGVYHFATIVGETASHPNCTHYTPCEGICGEKFTQFVDSGD